MKFSFATYLNRGDAENAEKKYRILVKLVLYGSNKNQ